MPRRASWGLVRVNAELAWAKTKGDADVCVVGSGVSGLKVVAGFVDQGIRLLHVVSVDPSAGAVEIRTALRAAATPLPGIAAEQQGAGMIDASKLIR